MVPGEGLKVVAVTIIPEQGPMYFDDEDVASIAHDANNALEAVLKDEAPSMPWSVEPPAIRSHVLAMVRMARAGCTQAEIHEGWCNMLRTEGWIYGPEKDWTAMTHPCLLPFERLPPEQQAKTALFQHIVIALTL
jgi:RyR domain-containing protein